MRVAVKINDLLPAANAISCRARRIQRMAYEHYEMVRNEIDVREGFERARAMVNVCRDLQEPDVGKVETLATQICGGDWRQGDASV